MKNTDSFSKRPRDQYNQNSMGKGLKIPSGLYRGIVISNQDPDKLGRIKVQIMKFYGTFAPGQAPDAANPESYLGAMWCRMVLPFGGTGLPKSGPTGTVSQTSYGITGQLPEVDNEVIVAFGGDMHSGIVLGVLPDMERMAGINGAGTTQITASGESTIALETAKTEQSTDAPPDEHPQAAALRTQGLDSDRLRGQQYASPARDRTPQAMSMTTPIGHAITMDDGDPDAGSNQNLRIRSAGGAQIFMDDVNGMTYINNRDGSVWIEMNRNGDLDIYANTSINLHTRGSMNYHCGGNFNLQANGNINMKALGSINTEAAGGDFNIKSAGNANIAADGNGNLYASGGIRVTGARIDLNGPAAEQAASACANQLAGNTGVTSSVAARVPEAEPWNGHLDVNRVATGTQTGGQSLEASQSYYYGAPTTPGYTDQSGGWDQTGTNPYPQASAGEWFSFASGIDTRIDPQVLAMVNEVGKRFGRRLVISSGYRDPDYNRRVGGASKSRHLSARAVDISSGGLNNQDRVDLIGLASAVGFIGIGIYSGGSLHFDLREGARAGWGSSYSYGSVPGYAKGAIDKHIAGSFSGGSGFA